MKFYGNKLRWNLSSESTWNTVKNKKERKIFISNAVELKLIYQNLSSSKLIKAPK